MGPVAISEHALTMSRPVTIDDDDLIEAARAVFSELGMRATTAEIARRAGVSEGILFKRFRTKWELFHAVMLAIERAGKRWTDGLAARVGRGRIRDELESVAHEGIAFFRLLVPLHMMSGSSPEHHEIAKKDWGNTHPALESRRVFEAYFEAEKRLGRIGPVDVEVLARTFLGALYNFVAMEVLTGPLEEHPISDARYVRVLVDLLFGGIAGPRTEPERMPDAAPAPPRASRARKKR